jgi:hypothetical protein
MLALLHGPSKCTWEERHVEMADLPEGTVMQSVTTFVSFQTETNYKKTIFL